VVKHSEVFVGIDVAAKLKNAIAKGMNCNGTKSRAFAGFSGAGNPNSARNWLRKV
jgi:hypothetical protein